MKQSEGQTKSVKLSKDKLLGFRHLASLDDDAKLVRHAEDLFNKQGVEGVEKLACQSRTLDQNKLLGFRSLAPAAPAGKDFCENSRLAFNKIGPGETDT